jgi:dipeptidyl aminopeptidase/acylaminoacyl peptidase
VYFTAAGRERERDPYYQHLYRARPDGSEIQLLTPEDAEHEVVLAPSLDHFVDTFSRVDLPPVTVLRRSDGVLAAELERADIEPLLHAGYQLPERFTVKARDGQTDLYGVLVRPANFDPAGKYPVVDSIYPGPQRIHTPKAFALGIVQGRRDPLGHAQSFAQLGFVTVIVDGLGTPFRSRAFREFSYGRLQDAGGIEDHVLAVQELGRRHPFIDTSRVGIYGHSAGGFASARAILAFPDFFKVAVAGCGNHDPRLFIAGWSERYQGPIGEADYASLGNASLAGALKGKLLLLHGELDENVTPAQTIRLVSAFLDAGKDVDMFILPNTQHQLPRNIHFHRKRWSYFLDHL